MTVTLSPAIMSRGLQSEGTGILFVMLQVLCNGNESSTAKGKNDGCVSY